jgi:hypothetical protein
VQSNGDIVAAGSTSGATGVADAVFARFSASGALDPSFGSGGTAYVPSAQQWEESGNVVPGATSLTIAPNGDLVAAGQYIDQVIGSATAWALTPSGTFDTSFAKGGTATYPDPTGTNTAFAGLALSPTTGDLLAAGTSTPIPGATTGLIAAYGGFGVPKTTTPTTPPAPPLKLGVTGLKRSYKIATVERHGLRVVVSCSAACSVTGTLSAKLSRHRTLTIRFSTRLKSAGRHTFTLRLTKKERSLLASIRRVKATLRVVATPSAPGKRAIATKSLTLER